MYIKCKEMQINISLFVTDLFSDAKNVMIFFLNFISDKYAYHGIWIESVIKTEIIAGGVKSSLKLL
jgi:hypothetical protein